MHVEEAREAEPLPERPGGLDRSPAVRREPVDQSIPLSRRPRACSFSRSAWRAASDWRLSQVFLPLASAISTLARPSLKYRAVGTMVKPFSLTLRSIFSISSRLSSSLRLRRAEWLVQVPWVYSGMCTPCSHASCPSMSTNPSTSDARPSRSDFTSVPTSTSPAS